MVKKARKYGEAWKDVQIDANQFDRVYDKLIRSPSLPTQNTDEARNDDQLTITLTDEIALSVNDTLSVNDSPSHYDTPSVDATVSQNDRVARKQGGLLPSDDRVPYRGDGVSSGDTLSAGDSQVPAFSLLKTLPSGGGYFPSFNVIEDHLIPQLDPMEQAIYRRLVRLSWGHRRNTCIVGYPKLAEKSGMKRTAAREATQRLEKKGLIKKLGMQLDPTAGEQGNIYLVFVPDQVRDYWSKEKRTRSRNDTLSANDTLSPNDLMKEHDVFVSKNTRTQIQKGAGVGSRFNLEECRRYANHLKTSGQGITNPGGYATKIFRSGEADALVEAFLNPPALLDITQCPDCRGMGMYYPNGIGNGPVVKCKHARLGAASS